MSGQRNIAQFFIEFDNVLKKHLETVARSLKCLFPKVQKELIRRCQIEIRKRRIDNCEKSKLFAVCADETTICKEQLSICIRCVNSENVDASKYWKIDGVGDWMLTIFEAKDMTEHALRTEWFLRYRSIVVNIVRTHNTYIVNRTILIWL